MLAKKPESTAGCQVPRVIVDFHREQARCHRRSGYSSESIYTTTAPRASSSSRNTER